MSKKNNNDLKIYYNPKNKFNTYLANAKAICPIGTIYRIYNKRTGKSLINASEDVKNDIKNIVNKLEHGIFYIKEIQEIWNKDHYQFAAEDLQHYYNENQIQLLLNIWKIYFGGKDFELLYNIDNNEQSEIINIQNDNKKLMEENQYYATYSTKLLNENKKLQDQVNILNTNLLQLQSYDLKIYNNLTEINNAILKHIIDAPIQVLQMLTSLLAINTAEINKQNNISQTDNIINKIQLQEQINVIQDNDINNNEIFNENNFSDKENINKIQADIVQDTPVKEKIDNMNCESINMDEDISSEKLIQSKLKTTPKRVYNRRVKKVLKIQTDDGFMFFNGNQSLDEWCEYAFNWLKKDHINFANELKQEIAKSISRNKVSKALQILIDYVSGKSYDELATKFNLTRELIIRYIDSLQNTAPAIYLGFGCGRKNSLGKDKRVITVLNNKNITDVPLSF